MVESYDKRWGHPRYRKAVKHLEIKAQKRKEAEARNAIYQTMTLLDKLKILMLRPGNSTKQVKRLAFIKKE